MNPDLTVFWVIFFVLLTGLCLDRLILRPLLRVMGEREGAVTAASALAETAAAKARAATAEFETKTQAARTEIYREMDEKRRQALERRSKLLTRPPELPNPQPLHQPPNRNSTRFTRTTDGLETATP